MKTKHQELWDCERIVMNCIWNERISVTCAQIMEPVDGGMSMLKTFDNEKRGKIINVKYICRNIFGCHYGRTCSGCHGGTGLFKREHGDI